MLLKCNSLTKEYMSLSGSCVFALSEINFSLSDNEFLSVVGPSGSGKSTLLNIIAGILEPTSGEIRFKNSSLPRMGYVLQANALFPWFTVERNLAYPLELQGISRRDRKTAAEELCVQLGLSPEQFLNKYPKELSGGELRRVAIGMALAMKPSLLLLDEPGSQLDYAAKWDVQLLIQQIAQSRGLAGICVTHDLEEAVFLGDRVMVLNGGHVANLIDISLPKPRNNETRTSKEFIAYRQQLMGHHSAST